MIRRVTLALAAAFLCCTSAVSQAALTAYSQNFESMALQWTTW